MIVTIYGSIEGILEAKNYPNRCPQDKEMTGDMEFYQKEFYDDNSYLPPYNEDDHFFTILTADQFLGPYKMAVPALFPMGAKVGDYDLKMDEETTYE